MRSLARPGLIAFLAALILAPGSAEAHHIMGVPHYAYSEEYPQTPVLTYKVLAGRYDLRMMGYPGKPKPGETCTLSVVIQERESRETFPGKVYLTVREDVLVGEDPIIYGPMEALWEDGVFKFSPNLPKEANYIVRVHYQADGAPWDIDLPMTAGDPGSPLATLGIYLGALLALVIIVRAIRIKLDRRAAAEAKE